MEKELQKIGHRIKLLRIENKISQKVLAKKLCISQTHLSNIENGRVGVTLLHLIKIKELFECPIEYFFEEKTLSENEAEKNECQKIKTIVEENNFRLEDLSKAIEIIRNNESFTERLKINTSIVGRKLIFHEKNK